MSVPALIAETIPVLLIEAIPAETDDHPPPEIVSVSVSVAPAQRVIVPEMLPGSGVVITLTESVE